MRVVGAGQEPHTTSVAEVMTRDPLCFEPSKSVRELLEVATDKRCRHFPIVENDRLIGLVSIGDLVRWEIKDQESRIDAGIRAVKAVTGR